MRRPCQNLSSRQRARTPLPFARFLVNLVRDRCGDGPVAILWTQPDTAYWLLWPAVEVWGEGKDARRYGGPWPIIAHPPCGPWGKYRAVSRQDPVHGILAIELVHRWGGVVEQPLGSRLFREHGVAGVNTIKVDQGDYGHPAIKPTILYVVPRSPTPPTGGDSR